MKFRNKLSDEQFGVQFWLSLSCAIWVLGGWLLPGFGWSHFFLCNYMEVIQLMISVQSWHLVLSLSGCALLLCFCACRPKLLKQPLWYALIAYVALHAFSPEVYRLSSAAVRGDSLVLLAVDAGLLSVVVADSTAGICCAIMLLCTGQAVFDIYYACASGHALLSGTVPRFAGSFAQPESLYGEMLFALPLSVTAAVSGEQRTSIRILSAICGVVQFISLLLTWYRAGIMGGALAIIFLAWKLCLNKKGMFCLMIACLVLILSACEYRSAGDRNRLSTAGSDRGHLMLIRDGWYHFRHHWQMGEGMTIHQLFLVDPKVRLPPSYYPDPKNILLEWLDESGVAGGCLFIFFIYSVALAIGHNRSMIAYGIGAAWVGVLTAGIFGTPFGLPMCTAGTAIAASLIGAILLLRPNTLVADSR